MSQSIFTISLDFEIHWGVSDHRTIESYRENLMNVPVVIDRLLKLFEKNNIHATWATVGMLFCYNKQELESWVHPADQPTYSNNKLSNYSIIYEAGENESDDPFHYGQSIIQKILNTPGQELATHTFSHYYCLEPGQTLLQFEKDIHAAIKIHQRENNIPMSIVFPRNQYSDQYLEICKQNDVLCYRGNYNSWMYKAEAKSTESFFKRIARIADNYLPFTGSRYVFIEKVFPGMVNIPASCFLRPYNKKMSFLEPLRLLRIKNEMNAATKKNAIYHLWWHPHNFGKNVDENFKILESILDHFQQLKKKSGMVSLSMKEIYEQFTRS
jgi:peptidoglycan/xylan/chitin deacetylase (PgdA/CDA1 family)